MATQGPSEHARELVRGSYDLHVHLEPDVMKRRIDDLGVARRSLEVGLAGFVLKSHYVPTGERASVVRKAVPGVDVRGAITLNNSVGGMNPTAVEIAARSGASIVWFPTVDSANQRSSQSRDPEGARPPMWAALQQELSDRGISAGPVPVLTEEGSVTEDVRQVLALIAAARTWSAASPPRTAARSAGTRCSPTSGPRGRRAPCWPPTSASRSTRR
jgi:hypothetical protein